MLHADLEKCKVTQRLQQARSFCILGKKLLDKEESMIATEEGKKNQEKAIYSPKTGSLVSS